MCVWLLPDIMEDMKEECQKYGSVISLLIPRENPGKGQVWALTPAFHLNALQTLSSHTQWFRTHSRGPAQLLLVINNTEIYVSRNDPPNSYKTDDVFS